MSRTLPERPSLENLKKQANDLAKAYRAREPDAVERVAAVGRGTPKSSTDHRLILADAQYIVAREYGLKSWPHLVRHLALSLQFATFDLRSRVRQLHEARCRQYEEVFAEM